MLKALVARELISSGACSWISVIDEQRTYVSRGEAQDVDRVEKGWLEEDHHFAYSQ